MIMKVSSYRDYSRAIDDIINSLNHSSSKKSQSQCKEIRFDEEIVEREERVLFGIGNVGMRRIIDWVFTNNATSDNDDYLEALVLKYNNINDEPIRYLLHLAKLNGNCDHNNKLKKLYELDLFGNDIGVAGATCLSDCLEYLPRLSILNLGGNNIATAGAVKIAVEISKLSLQSSQQHATDCGITYLNLSDNSIGSDGAEAIAAMLKINKSIQTLILSNNSIRHQGAKFIAGVLGPIRGTTVAIAAAAAKGNQHESQYNTTLTHLNLSGNAIGHQGATLLWKMLQFNKTIKIFDISCNGISSKGIPKASSSSPPVKNDNFGNKSLQKLNISNNDIGNDGAVSLAELISNLPSLTSLDISRNNITTNYEIITIAVAKNNSITTLLMNNNLFEAGFGGANIAEKLLNSTALTHLDISWCLLQDSGIVKLAKLMKSNKSLKFLNIENNNFSAVGAKSFAQAMVFNNSLTTLKMGGNKIYVAGGTAIARSIACNNLTLTSLSLDRSGIGNEGVRAFARSLTVTTALRFLDIHYNSASEIGVDAITNAVTATTGVSLTSLNIGGEESVPKALSNGIIEILKEKAFAFLSLTESDIDPSTNKIYKEFANSAKDDNSKGVRYLYCQNVQVDHLDTFLDDQTLASKITSITLLFQ